MGDVMFNSMILHQVEEIYSRGGNIMQFLKGENKNAENSKESILISYDYQSGTYIEAYKKNPENCHKYTKQLSDEISTLGDFTTILEAGVGEATTFKQVTKNLVSLENCYGFDISWSRLKAAKDFLAEDGDKHSNLFVADLFDIPLADNSIDIVYTAHSVEPNGGYEKPILEELYRVTKKYLLLFEPDYDLASTEARQRMESHGYIKGLVEIAATLGYNVIKHKLLQFSMNPLNPTSVIVIKKDSNEIKSDNVFQCPISKTELTDCGEIYFAKQPHLMYPVIKNIPCLLKSQAILGFKYE
jgi:ubiquinone/menaquinone biosynthesis C-methylase UbiE